MKSSDNSNSQLTILPSLRVMRLPGGNVSITRKFLSGIDAYLQRWRFPVTVLMDSGPVGDNLDNEAVDPTALPFRLVIDGDLPKEIARSAVVLATAVEEQTHVSELCRSLGVPCAYVTELSLRTRLQIMRNGTRNPVLRLRRTVWQVQHERRLRRAIARASGVQCNGVPTFEAYRSLTSSPLLFFDTRSSVEDIATPTGLGVRLSALMRGEPLRLVFSGRLVRIKGVDHLIEVARHLRGLGVPFRMTICGDGELSASMHAQIGDLPIEMPGLLDFGLQLQPLLKQSADLFICCHRQGDPSCTYLETMAAGVPIVSYDNEAFLGIQAVSGVGWSVPMDRPDLMAQKIASLSRDELAEASRKSLAFAARHTFDSVFDQRVAHLRALSRTAT